MDAVEKAVAALNEVERLILVKTVKNSLFLYEQLTFDENGEPKEFSLVDWYENYLLHPSVAHRNAKIVRSAAENEPYEDFGNDMVRQYVKRVYDAMDEQKQKKLRITVLSILEDYGPYGLDTVTPLLGQVRALVWPLVEKELG